MAVLQKMLKPEYLRNQKTPKRLTIISEKITSRPSIDINIYFFHSVYPEKLGNEISKIKISKLCVITADFDSLQVYTN